MATLKEIRQRLGWAEDQLLNFVEKAGGIPAESPSTSSALHHVRTARADVVAIIEGEPEPLTPSAPGIPTFEAAGDAVQVSWTAADRATRYVYMYGPDDPPSVGGIVSELSVIVPLSAGDTFRVVPENEHGYGPYAESTYQ